MIDFILHMDRELLLQLNGVGVWYPLDLFFAIVTNKYTWIPLYLLLFYLLFVRFGKGYKGLLSVLGLLVAVGLADFISVHGFKEVFHRLRPCHEPLLEGLVDLWKGKCGGKFSFVSSHAANSFAIAAFILKSRIFGRYSYWIMIWAGFVAYSRVYLGVHYPLDILCGSILGYVMGTIGWWLFSKVNRAN